MQHVITSLLFRLARRCPIHDRASHAVTSRLERELGMKPSFPPVSFVDAYSDPNLLNCDNAWCRARRR